MRALVAIANRRYDRPLHRQVTASTASRAGGYGAGCAGRWPKSRHAWRTGTPTRLAAARTYAAAANRAYCQRSSVRHRAASSSRSRVRSRRAGLLRPAPRTGASRSGGRGRRARAGTARAVPPGPAGRPGWPRTSPARPRRRGGTPRRGRCCLAGAGGKFAGQLEDVNVALEPVKQEATGSHGALGAGALLCRHVTTVRQTRRSPCGLRADARRAERLPPTGAPACSCGTARRTPSPFCSSQI